MSKKLIGVIASIALVLSMVGVSATQAAALTQAQISAIVSLLQSFGADATTVANVTASLNGQPTSGTVTTTTSGYNFATNLTIGSNGTDVTTLQQVLVGTGDLVMPSGVAYGYFGNLTKQAVIKYQLRNGISPAAGYVGPVTRARLNASSGSTTTTTTTGTTSGTDLSVSLAPTSPVSGAVVAGQAIADLVEYTFTNKSATPAVVTNVTLQRGGVSNDAALTGVYLYNGVTRLTDAASISSGKISFNAPSGLFTVPAGSSMTIAVRADVLTGTTYNGQILVISLTGVTSNLPIAAVYPISGSQQTISSATLATVAVASSSPSATDIDPQNDYVMWSGTAAVGTNDVYLKSIALRQIGSVSAGELSNFRFYVDGVQKGATLLAYDANGYLTFDLSANPFKLTTGTHIIKLIGDVIGGSTKTFSFSIRQASDINVVDSQLNVNVLSTAAQTFPLTAGTQTVLAGSMTVVKATDSPAGNVTLSSSGVTLAKYTLKASGEPVKIEDLTVSFAGSNIGPLRNGALFANGVQVGSSASIGSTTATEFTSVNLVVYPGSPVTLEVRSDITAASGAAIANGDTIKISLVLGASNANLQKSLGYINVPTATVAANTLTVAQGTLTLTKTSYANQSIIAPQTAMKLGSYSITAGTTEDLLINTVIVNFLGATASTSATTTNITDVYFTFGNQTSNNKSTIVSADNSYSVNYTLPAGQTREINVYGTIASAIGATDIIVTKLQVSGQTANSVQTVAVPTSSTYTTGQTISITTGVLTPAVYATAASSTVIGGNLVKAGSFQFIATGDTFTVDQLTGFVPSTSVGNVSSVVYQVNGASINGSGTTFDGVTGIATTTGLSIIVPANNSNGVIVDAYLQLASIGTPGAASSSKEVLFTLEGYEKMTSTGVPTEVDAAALAGNTQYAYASVPTITNMTLPETGTASLIAGTKTLARIKISADAAGAIDWNMIQFRITKPAAVSLGTTTANLGAWSLTDDSGNTIPGAFSSTTGALDLTATAGDIRFIATSPETIGAGSNKVYRLKTTVSGTIAANDAVTTQILAGTTGHIQSTTAALARGSIGAGATFAWSDRSFAPHSVLTPDWNNDTLIKNLPTDTQQIIN